MDQILPIIPSLTVFLTFLCLYYFFQNNDKRYSLIISFVFTNILYVSFNKIFLYLKIIDYYYIFVLINFVVVIFYLASCKTELLKDIENIKIFFYKNKKSFYLYIFIIFFIYIFFQSLFIPPTNFDSLAYNITRNYLFIQENSIYPNNNFNYQNILIQPLNSDLLYLIFAYFSSDYFMNIFNLLSYVIAGIVFFEFLNKFNVKKNKFIYLLLFLSISNFFLSLFNTKNDLYSATFLIINLYLLFKIIEGDKKNIPIFLLSVFYSSGIKWLVIFYLLPLFAVTVVYCFRKNLIYDFIKYSLIISPLALILAPIDTIFLNYKFTGSFTGAIETGSSNLFLHQEGLKGMLANFIRYLIMSIDISIPIHKIGLEEIVALFDTLEKNIQLLLFNNSQFGISSIFKNEIKFNYSYVLRPHSDFVFFGIYGFISFITPFLVWKFKEEKQFIIMFISIIFLILFCYNISWFPWNARYLLPFIFLGSILFASLDLNLKEPLKKLIIIYSFLIITFNLLAHVPQPLIKHSKTESWLTIFKDRDNFKKFVIPEFILIKNLKKIIKNGDNFLLIMNRNDQLVRFEGHYQSIYALLKEFDKSYIKFADTNFETLNQSKQIKRKLTNKELKNYLYIINLSDKNLIIDDYEIISNDEENFLIFKKI